MTIYSFDVLLSRFGTNLWDVAKKKLLELIRYFSRSLDPSVKSNCTSTVQKLENNEKYVYLNSYKVLPKTKFTKVVQETQQLKVQLQPLKFSTTISPRRRRRGNRMAPGGSWDLLDSLTLQSPWLYGGSPLNHDGRIGEQIQFLAKSRPQLCPQLIDFPVDTEPLECLGESDSRMILMKMNRFKFLKIPPQRRVPTLSSGLHEMWWVNPRCWTWFQDSSDGDQKIQLHTNLSSRLCL